MKVVQINSTCGSGSIGKICIAVSKLLTKNGVENYIFYSMGQSNYPLAVKYSNNSIRNIQAIYDKCCGLNGFGDKISTWNLILRLKKIQPDIVHIHNIHSHDCDASMLFKYLKSENIKVFWTFHDCWAFTGYCTHFMMNNCPKWKEMCHDCPSYKKYSFWFDKSSKLFLKKKYAIDDANLTIITPSLWLKNIVKDSFLKRHDVYVINNGINLEIFKPRQSDFKIHYKCQNKIILLGIANGWPEGKNLKSYITLANELDNRFQIVLLGTNKRIDKVLPPNIISIHRTENQIQLAEIYSAVDILVNLTLEENFPTVNIEAIACGTPVVTYDTGGCFEMLDDTCGVKFKRGDLESVKQYLTNLELNKLPSINACVSKAKEYSETICFQNYIKLYNL